MLNMDRNKEMRVAFVPWYQNLYSGKRRINGLNSSFTLVGSDGPVVGSRSS